MLWSGSLAREEDGTFGRVQMLSSRKGGRGELNQVCRLLLRAFPDDTNIRELRLALLD